MGTQEAGAGEVYIDGAWIVFKIMWMSVVMSTIVTK